jgi:hypothetical protein
MSKKITFLITIIGLGIIVGLAVFFIGQQVFGVISVQNEIDMTGNTLTGLPVPTQPSDAVRKNYFDDAIATAADADWVISGDNIYRTTGNVGIGTSNPGANRLYTRGANQTTSTNSCTGTPHPCLTVPIEDCDLHDFCQIIGTDCKGTHAPCSNYTAFGQASCESHECQWTTSTRWASKTAIFDQGKVGIGDTDPYYVLELPNIGDSRGRARANQWLTYSSKRWKENIIPIDNALDKVSQLQGVYFDWKPEHGGTHGIGLIAEDVGKVIPELVDWEDDGTYARSLDYDRLTGLLVEAIKEQQQEIGELKKEIEKLKQQIEELKAIIMNKE